MAFHPKRAYAVFWKDLLDLRKNLGLLGSMFILPILLVIVPTGVVYAYTKDPTDTSLRTMALYYDPTLAPSVSASAFLVEKTLADWFGIYLLMPLFVPILISSHSVAGEKERRTLEPLLASPATAGEIFAGKTMAALLPALGVTWIAFGLLCASVDAVSVHFIHKALLPNGLWVFGVVVIAPLFAFFGNGVAVIVSGRVGETRLAQQFSGLVTLPLLGLAGAQVAGFLRSGTLYYATLGGIILVLDLFLVVASVRLFDRERLISRWT